MAIPQRGLKQHLAAGGKAVNGWCSIPSAVTAEMVARAGFDIAGHRLRAVEHALAVRVVDGGEVRAAVGGDLPAGAGEQGYGCVLQAALGDAEFECALLFRWHLLRFRFFGFDVLSEAADRALVTDQAVAVDGDAEEQGVGVAVGAGADDAQAVPAGFALHPELVAGAAEEGDEAGAEGVRVAFFVEEAEHEDFAGFSMLDDAGNEAAHLVEVEGGKGWHTFGSFWLEHGWRRAEQCSRAWCASAGLSVMESG